MVPAAENKITPLTATIRKSLKILLMPLRFTLYVLSCEKFIGKTFSYILKEMKAYVNNFY